MAFEDDYQDVLQNMEFAIIAVYRRRQELVDYDVDVVLAALVKRYQAEQRQRQPPLLRLTELRQEVFDAVEAVCDWRLGRPEFTAPMSGPVHTRPVSTDDRRDTGVPQAHSHLRQALDKRRRATGLPDVHRQVHRLRCAL